MILPTHVAYSLALSGFVGMEKGHCILLAVGSALPDLDYPRSFVGRLMPFVSIPAGKKLGHRQVLHGYPLWFLIALGGWVFEPLLFVGLGGISHVFLDCHNVAGVQALKPFSDIKLVNFKRNWRVYTGSNGDLVLCLIFTLIFYAGVQVRGLGGVQQALGNALGSYAIVYERYLQQGTKVCYLRGKLRFTSGETVTGQWLIVGKEGQKALALWDKTQHRLIHLPREGEFLRVELEVTEELWERVNFRGAVMNPCGAFSWDKQKDRWRYLSPAMVVSGSLMRRGGCPERATNQEKIGIDYGRIEGSVRF